MDRRRFAREFVNESAEVADMYTACLNGSRAVTLMEIRYRRAGVDRMEQHPGLRTGLTPSNQTAQNAYS
jgi:hypothetical protein